MAFRHVALPHRRHMKEFWFDVYPCTQLVAVQLAYFEVLNTVNGKVSHELSIIEGEFVRRVNA